MNLNAVMADSAGDMLTFLREQQHKEQLVYEARRAQPKSYGAIRPTPAEEALASSEPGILAPCCPACGNVDARPLLGHAEVEMVHSHGGFSPPCPKPFELSTSMHFKLGADEPEYMSEPIVTCLACPEPTRFGFRQMAYLFNPSLGPLNVKRVALSYVVRTLLDKQDKPGEPDESEEKDDAAATPAAADEVEAWVQ
jgi:hypothetical protein